MIRRLFVVMGLLAVLAMDAAEGRPQAGRQEVEAPKDSASVSAWGLPLPGGPIRVLFVAPRHTLRDVAELAARLQIDSRVAALWDATHIGGEDPSMPGAGEDATLKTLRDSLAKGVDVVVLGNFKLSILPEDLRADLMARIKGGLGLIVVNQRSGLPDGFAQMLADLKPDASASSITRGIGQELTPEWPSTLQFVHAGLAEKGRVVHLDYPGNRPETSFLLPSLTDPIHARDCYLDTYLSLVAKAVRWAAKRDPENWVASFADVSPKGPSENEIPPDLPEEYVRQVKDGVASTSRQFALTLNQPAEKPYAVRARAREASRGITHLYTDLPPLPKGASNYTFELPLGPGSWLVDLWLCTRKQACVEWHTEAVRIQGWPEIEGLTYSKGCLLPNDTLAITMDIRPQYHRPRPCTVYARAVDSLGRRVAENSVPVGEAGGPVQLTLNFADLIANLVKVEVFAADTADIRPSRWELGRAAYGTPVYLPVRAPRPLNVPSFCAVTPAPDEYNIRAHIKALADLQVDSLVAPQSETMRFYFAAANMRPIPELASHVPESVSGALRVPCLSQPAFRESAAALVREQTPGFWAIGTSTYNLGLGACLASGGEDVCMCEQCQRGFQEWLEARYRSIDKLNASWRSAFGGFGEVRPLTRDEALDAAAEQDGTTYAPWLDFRRYMDTVFAGSLAFGREVIRSIDRDARSGMLALQGSRAQLGYDWWLLGSQLDAMAVPADPVVIEMVRSFLPPGAMAALACNGSDLPDEAGAASLPWRQVLHGFGALWHTSPFGTAGVPLPLPAMGPDGRPSPATQALAQNVARVKSGLGALWLNARPMTPRVAILASQSSLYINQIDLAYQCDSRRAEEGFIRILEDLTVPYAFISTDQLLAQNLQNVQLLILPTARALSDAEVAALRAYHTSGGSLLADIAPGEFDEHGCRRQQMPLDDIFGVSHAALQPAIAGGDADVNFAPTPDSTPAKALLAGVTADTAVKPAGATATGTCGEASAWLVQSREKQATLLMNHAWPADAEAMRDATPCIKLLLDHVGVERMAPWFNAPTPAFEVFRHAFGAAELLAILPRAQEAPQSQKIDLRFEKDLITYDLLHRGTRIRPAKHTARLDRDPVALFASLPYEVTSVDVYCPEEVMPGTRIPIRVLIKTDGRAPGRHLLHITLTDPSGRSLPYYAMDAFCDNGECATYIPLALNENPGTYTLQVTDVLTTTVGYSQVIVQKPLIE